MAFLCNSPGLEQQSKGRKPREQLLDERTELREDIPKPVDDEHGRRGKRMGEGIQSVGR